MCVRLKLPRLLRAHVSSAILVGLAGAGCQRQPAPPHLDAVYWFNRVSPAWDVDVYINDEPAVHWVGCASGGLDVSQFVVDGQNHVRMVATWNGEYPFEAPFPRCEMGFARLKR